MNKNEREKVELKRMKKSNAQILTVSKQSLLGAKNPRLKKTVVNIIRINSFRIKSSNSEQFRKES